jgi:hypothetical protein
MFDRPSESVPGPVTSVTSVTSVAGGNPESVRLCDGDSSNVEVAQAAHPWRLSHELRTPLNAILGGVELLLDGSTGPLSREARACLGDVHAAGRQLMREVQDLLLLAQIRERAEPIADQPVDIVALLHEAYAQVWPSESLSLDMAADARLVIRGAQADLRVLAMALIDLPSAHLPVASPDQLPCRLALRVERHRAGGRLELRWPTFEAAWLGSIRSALIVTVLTLHEASMALLDDGGLRLDWPAVRLG